MENSTKGILFVLGAIATGVIPVVATTMITNRGPGLLVESHFIERGGGVALLVVDEAGGRAHTYRMNVIDTKLGMRTQRVFAGGTSFTVLGHDAKHMWTSEVPSDLFATGTDIRESVSARDPESLAVRMDQAALERKNPMIAQGIRSGHSTFDKASGGLHVESRSGDPFLIDGDDFAASPSASQTTPPDDINPRLAFLASGDVLAFDEAGHFERQDAQRSVSKKLHEDFTYESATFVNDKCARVAVALDGSYFVVWRKTRGDFATSVISRVTESGERKWSTNVQTGEPENGRIVGELLIVVMKQPANYVVALDAKSGEQRWRYDL